MTMLDIVANGGTNVEQKVVAIAKVMILSARDCASRYTHVLGENIHKSMYRIP